MPLTRRHFIGAGALLATTTALPRTFAHPASTADPDIAAALDAGIRASLAAYACPGIAVHIAHHGRTLHARNAGQANLETATPVDGDSVFRIGSLSKQFTAALIVKLAAQGRVSLDADAANLLPFFRKSPRFTLRELLHHTAGLHEDDGDSVDGATATPITQIDIARQISQQKKLFDFAPGTAWRYSNTNYIVLGAVVEKITGMSLADAARTMIFTPLGLHATAFDRVQDVVPGRVSGYSPQPDARTHFDHAAFIDIAQAGGAGAMRSTASDLCRWHHALFTHRLFDARHTDLMTTPGRLRDGRLSGSHRFLPADDAAYGPVQYGMGLLLPPPLHGHRSVMHYGFINGFAVCLETWLDVGLSTAILCNGDMGPHMPFHALRQTVSKQLLPKLAT
ncbi:serine hydrolase domain-containing protein [Oleiagrimonas soli]|uniref:CubicO group peptidase (Beta-lactamase class C family) n=1 Tax=Oleiagrimonas soli TaxID=1543381 RepID=A0A099CUK4_9GAMM|nr:serine hydrolase domain-containing protein [Oleiagrimonas soli]KGI76690.1 hypothetical protein LF63_0114080 [Oleiagrimonas soli]MBB6185088.1 CubicO group peptidase (beta-lactamase class C family) [Oleiagrimonas soli]